MAREDPSDPFPPYALALELLTTDPNRSTEILHEILTRHPKYLPTYYQLARLLVEQGLASQAVPILQQGARLAAETGDKKTQNELQGLLDEVE